MRVAIITEDEDAPMVARLEAELSAFGLTPSIVHRVPPADVGPVIREVGGVAAFAMRDGLLAIVVEDERGRTVTRDLPIPTDDPVAESRVGVRAIETLRAGLMEVHADQIARGVDVSSLTLVELAELGGEALPVATSGNYMLTTLTLGTELVAGNLNANPLLNLDVGIAYGASERVDVTLSGSIPVVRTRYSDKAGEAVFGVTVVDAGAAYHLSDPDNAWVPTLGAGLGLMFLRVSGEAVPPYSDETVSAIALAPYVRWGLSYWPGGPIRIRGDLHASVSQKAAIFFVNREVGFWGPLQTGIVVGVEVDLR